MVSAHTAQTMRQHKMISRRFALDKDSFVYTYQAPFKGIFHADHLPATVGMFGALLVFALMSLQFALTPFIQLEQQTIAYQQQTQAYLASIDVEASPQYLASADSYPAVLGAATSSGPSLSFWDAIQASVGDLFSWWPFGKKETTEERQAEVFDVTPDCPDGYCNYNKSKDYVGDNCTGNYVGSVYYCSGKNFQTESACSNEGYSMFGTTRAESWKAITIDSQASCKDAPGSACKNVRYFLNVPSTTDNPEAKIYPNKTYQLVIRRREATNCSGNWDNVNVTLDGVNQGVELCDNAGEACEDYYHTTINSGSIGKHTLQFTINNGSCLCNTMTFETVAETGPATALDAQLSSNIPTQMTAGQTYQVAVTAKNIGSESWTEANKHRLAWSYQDQTDSCSDFSTTSNCAWKIASTWKCDGTQKTGSCDKREFLAAGDTIATNQQKVWNLTFKAPAQPGTYPIKLRMAKEAVAYFGPELVTNVVVSNAATCTIDRPATANAVATGNSIAFSWSAVTGASRYILEVRKKGELANCHLTDGQNQWCCATAPTATPWECHNTSADTSIWTSYDNHEVSGTTKTLNLAVGTYQWEVRAANDMGDTNPATVCYSPFRATLPEVTVATPTCTAGSASNPTACTYTESRQDAINSYCNAQVTAGNISACPAGQSWNASMSCNGGSQGGKCYFAPFGTTCTSPSCSCTCTNPSNTKANGFHVVLLKDNTRIKDEEFSGVTCAGDKITGFKFSNAQYKTASGSLTGNVTSLRVKPDQCYTNGQDPQSLFKITDNTRDLVDWRLGMTIPAGYTCSWQYKQDYRTDVIDLRGNDCSSMVITDVKSQEADGNLYSAVWVKLTSANQYPACATDSLVINNKNWTDPNQNIGGIAKVTSSVGLKSATFSCLGCANASCKKDVSADLKWMDVQTLEMSGEKSMDVYFQSKLPTECWQYHQKYGTTVAVSAIDINNVRSTGTGYNNNCHVQLLNACNRCSKWYDKMRTQWVAADCNIDPNASITVTRTYDSTCVAPAETKKANTCQRCIDAEPGKYGWWDMACPATGNPNYKADALTDCAPATPAISTAAPTSTAYMNQLVKLTVPGATSATTWQLVIEDVAAKTFKTMLCNAYNANKTALSITDAEITAAGCSATDTKIALISKALRGGWQENAYVFGYKDEILRYFNKNSILFPTQQFNFYIARTGSLTQYSSNKAAYSYKGVHEYDQITDQSAITGDGHLNQADLTSYVRNYSKYQKYGDKTKDYTGDNRVNVFDYRVLKLVVEDLNK